MPRNSRSLPLPRADDVLVTGVVLLVLAAAFVFPVDPDAPAPDALGAVLAAGTAVPLLWRRDAPFAVALVVAAFTVASVVHDQPGQPMQYGGAVAVYSLASLGGRWQRRTVLAGWVAGAVAVSLVAGDRDVVGVGFAVLTIVTAHALGRLSSGRRERISLLERAAQDAARAAALEAERATWAERQRMAREVHDVVAHAVSVMIVQAEAGAAAVEAGEAPSARHYDAVAEVGRGAIEELRGTLATMRDDAAARPPTLGDLAPVVDRARSTGLHVDVHAHDDVPTLSPDLEVAVVRIVQESLTNTIRHAAASRVDVRLAVEGAHLVLQVDDDGRARTSARSPRGGHGGQGGHGGHGLRGMAERAQALGGTLEAGPVAGPGAQGFRVRASFPLGTGAA